LRDVGALIPIVAAVGGGGVGSLVTAVLTSVQNRKDRERAAQRTQLAELSRSLVTAEVSIAGAQATIAGLQEQVRDLSHRVNTDERTHP
jgi:hypothetical protein